MVGDIQFTCGHENRPSFQGVEKTHKWNMNLRTPERQMHEAKSLPNSVAQIRPSSSSIPIANTIRRSNSDYNLAQSQAEADYKDYLFYSRVVQGISSKKSRIQYRDLQYENELSLHNIVRTRNDYTFKKNLAVDDCNDYSSTYGNPLEINEQETSETGVFDLEL